MTNPDPAGAAEFGMSRLLTLAELCAWLNITERHARKLVERNAIPYRKVGHLLRFCEAEVDRWSRPPERPREEFSPQRAEELQVSLRTGSGRRCSQSLPKYLLE